MLVGPEEDTSHFIEVAGRISASRLHAYPTAASHLPEDAVFDAFACSFTKLRQVVLRKDSYEDFLQRNV